MAHVWKDRVLESSTTTGTGDFTLAGAIAGFRTFASVCTTGDMVYYYIEGVDASGVPTGEWETGLGTYSASNTLTRTTLLDSSTGSAIDFSAGTKRVGLTRPAAVSRWQIVGTWAWSSNVASVEFTGLGGYEEFHILTRNISRSVSGQTGLRCSVDNGSSYYSSSGDYIAVTDAGIESSVTSAALHEGSTTAARSATAHIGGNIAGAVKEIYRITRSPVTATILFVASTDAINALQFVPLNGGNFTAGSITILGKR